MKCSFPDKILSCEAKCAVVQKYFMAITARPLNFEVIIDNYLE